MAPFCAGLVDVAGVDRCGEILVTAAKMLASKEVRSLLESAHGSRWEAFVTIALHAGLRRGELLALDWPAYDENAQRISVHCAMTETREHGMRKKETKTGKTREIPIDDVGARALARQRVLQAEDELAAPHGRYRNAENAIFTDELGARYSPAAATHAFERLARKAKLSTTRLHDLRHHAASELLSTGTDPALVARLMGHTVETLLRIYSHARPDGQREERAAIERLSARLAAAVNDRT
jgi:integrase